MNSITPSTRHTAAHQVSQQRIALDWSVGHHADANATPERFVPAQVPGAVQLDWAHAEKWPPHWVGDNFRDYDWMEDCYWTYRAQLPQISVADGQRLFFVCQGVDYEWELWLDGQKLHSQEGMFKTYELELLPAHAGKELQIRVYPAPKVTQEPRNRAQASHSVKPAVSYGWDWHPRLIPLGIWDETFLEVRAKTFLQRAEVFCSLNDDFSRAIITLEAEVDGVTASHRVRWQLLAHAGDVVGQIEGVPSETLRLELQNPQLWWPHDHGKPALYTSRVQLLEDDEVLDEKTTRVGVRRVRLVMHEGAWDWPSDFPKTRSNPPITLEINGRAIFSKGTNFVNADIFPGVVTRETLQPLLQAACEANMNLLRMWGGAPVQKEAFFEMCDEMGLMVWQEFPLACNPYPDDTDYLRVLDSESRAIIQRLRSHPSVVLWCGGNELFNSWSGMTDQALPLRLLNKNCYELDAQRPYLPTSPVMGMGHGHYVFYDTDNDIEAWACFQNAQCTAYTEFGCPGPSPVEVLKTFISESELFPPRVGTSWESHHAFGVWMENSWLFPDVIHKYFGTSDSLEAMVARGELLQCEGYKGLFEEARRQKPRSSMALNWCYNEAWPCAANNSLLCWPATPKPALYAVGAACRPTMASARIPKFQWNEGETFEAEMWLLHDAYIEYPRGQMQAFLLVDRREIPLLTWDFSALQPNANQKGPKIQFVLPGGQIDRFELHLRVVGQMEWDSSYTLALQPKIVKKEFQGDQLNF